MRRPLTAIATAAVTAALLVGPLASTGRAADATVRCSGSTPSAACPALQQAAASLAPLQPVLALAGPKLSSLMNGFQAMAAQASQPGGVSSTALKGQTQGLLGGLASLPKSVRDLLSPAKLDGLTGSLQALLAQLAAPTTDQSAADAGTPTPTPAAIAASGSSPWQPVSSPSRPATADQSGAAGAAGGPAIPPVPVGDRLVLGPLALPDFGFSQTVGSESAGPVAVDSERRVSVDRALSSGDSGSALALAALASLVLLATFGVARTRERAHVLTD